VELVDHRLGGADVEAGAGLDQQLGDDAVVDDGGVAL
jgi:hypothetical protein